MKKRSIGVKHVYLVRKASESTLVGDVVAGIDFVDDYRPNCKTSSFPQGIDRRYAEVNSMGGCIWYSDTVNFSSKEEGNDFFTQKKAEGYVIGTKEQYEAFVRRAGNLTY